jgi:hypothetical protein
MATFFRGALALMVAAAGGGIRAEETAEQRHLMWVQRIWDRAGHSAFTDLVAFQGRYFCVFREGSGHIPGLNGSIRVIESADGHDWKSAALLEETGVDLRDPKVSVTADGRLCVNMGGSFYHGSERLRMESRVSFSDEQGRHFSAPMAIQMPDEVRTDMDWLWRITWHEGTAWAAVQQLPAGKPRTLQLVRSHDALNWELAHTMSVPDPSETTLRFLPDGRMMALIRRSGPAPSVGWVGLSAAPFTEWHYRELDRPLGGPNVVALPGGKWLAATRDSKSRTLLALMDPETARVTPVVHLPSGGDASYAGMVVEPEKGRVLVSYYSSHEGKAAIYLAAVRLGGLEALSGARNAGAAP